MRGDERHDRQRTLLTEIEFVLRLERWQPGGDGMLLTGGGEIDVELAERIVSAEPRLVIPNPANDLRAELRPVRFFVGQRVGPTAVREVDDRQPAPIVDEFLQPRLRRVAQSGAIPTAVVQDEGVVSARRGSCSRIGISAVVVLRQS